MNKLSRFALSPWSFPVVILIYLAVMVMVLSIAKDCGHLKSSDNEQKWNTHLDSVILKDNQ